MNPETSGNNDQTRPIDPVPRGPAAAARGCMDDKVMRKDAVGTLLLLTTLGAADGTILLLAAAGKLATLGGAVTVGLTVVTGTGAWLAARDALAGRRDRNTAFLLAGVAALSTAATVAAAWLGATLGGALTLHVLPKAAGVVLGLVALEVGGMRLPRTAGIPAPIAALGVAISLEGWIQWTP